MKLISTTIKILLIESKKLSANALLIKKLSVICKGNMQIEAMFTEINLRKKKWLLSVSYNPHKALIGKHLQAVGKILIYAQEDMKTSL